MASDIRIAGCTCDMVVNPYGTGQIVEVSYSDPKPIAAEGYEIVSYEPERCQAITENTVSTVTEDGTELYRYETGPSHVITEDTSGDVEYSGSTNEQYDSSEGYVRSLTVEGKSERVVGKNIFPATLQVNGTNINQSRCTVTLSGDELSFAATNTDMSFGYTTYSAGVAYQDNFGALMPVTAGSSYTLTCTNTAFNKLFVLWWNASKQTISTVSFSSNVGTATAPSGAAYASLRIGKDDSVNGTTYKTKVQFEQGSTSTAYEPYFDPYLVSIEGVSVKGRNLANFTASSNYTVNADGTLTINATGGFNINFAALPSARYWVYMKVVSGGVSGDSVFTWQGSTYYNEYIGTSRQGSSASALSSIWVAGSANFTVGTVIQLMVSAESSTDWEPYSLTTITTPLRSAGSVHDTLMADADSWTVERRVGVVDLGTLTWTYSSNRMRSTGLANIIKIPATTSTVPNILAANKRAIAYASGLANNHDGIAIEDNNGGVLLCYAESAADSPTGLMFYELATPTQDPETSMGTIELGTAFTVATDLDSTFEMTVADSMMDVTSYFGYNCFTGPILAQVAYGNTASFVLETHIDFKSIVVRDSERVEYTLSDISCTVQDIVEYVQHPETGGWGSEQQKNLYIPWQDIR